MIALCRPHADAADHGAFTDDQLRTFKQEGNERAEAIRGRFEWMRRELLAVVGGNFYYRTPVILQIGPRPCVWFSRDDRNYLLLNFWMPTTSGQERAIVLENWWVVPPDVHDLECPPSGRLIRVRYPNGDDLKVEFFEIESAEQLARRYPDFGFGGPFPLTAVEVTEHAPGTPIEFGPTETRVGGMHMVGNVMVNVGVAIMLDLPAGVGGRTFRDEDVTLTDLVTADNPVLDRMRFENCRILGPAIIQSLGTRLDGCNLGDGPLDSILWERPTPGVGAIIANFCLFDHCQFIDVGFAMPPVNAAQFRRDICNPPGPAPQG